MFVQKLICNSLKVKRAKFLGKDWLTCFNSISMVCRFNPLTLTVTMSELGLTLSRSVLVIKTKVGHQQSMVAVQADKNCGDEWDLT